VIEYIVTVGIMLAFTALALKRNAVAYLSISFALVYFTEIILYMLSIQRLYSFFLVFAARYPPTWNIYTAIYLHSISPAHIFFNILFFFLAGLPFESRIGSRRLTIIFLVSGIVANICYSIILHIMGIDSLLIGASGAIFGVMGAFLVMYPEDEITFFLGPILLPRVKVKIAMLLLIGIEFLATMLWINDSVAHGAHVIGAVTGALLGRYFLSRGVSVRGARAIDEETFRGMATTEKLERILAKILNEDDEIVRRAWMEEFFTEKFGEFEIEGDYVKANGKKYRIYR